MSNTFYIVLFFAARYLLMFLMLWIPKFFKEPINPAEVKQSQKDRESMWPLGLILDTLALAAFVTYGDISLFMGGFWASLLLMMTAHIVVVEPLYYGFHLLLHVDWFYRNHHIYHHRSVRTEATTSMSFTLLERISYTILFAIPPVIAYFLGLFNFWAILAFFLLFDFLNSFGHLNIKLENKWYKNSPIRWFIYSPEYHERHHAEFLTNYSLFMPIFDRLFGTVSKKSFE